jgi:hypothetical protein
MIKTDIPQKALDKIEKCVKGYPNAWITGVCAYEPLLRKNGKCAYGADYDDDDDDDWGGYDRSKTGDVCHAGLNGMINKDHVVVNAHKKAWMNEAPDFVRWLFAEAPFNHGILNRDDFKQFSEHGMVIDMKEVGNGGALWLCKAMRHFTEDKHVPKLFVQLREHGLTGLQAFIGADIMTDGGEPKGGSHVSLFGYAPPGELRQWYDEFKDIKRIDGTNANRRHAVGYNHVFDGKVWGGLGHKVEKKSDGWGGYVEKRVACHPKDYVVLLKEIFEGDPKNVG